MKILIIVNHFFGFGDRFQGKSSMIQGISEIEVEEKKKKRLLFIDQSINSLNALEQLGHKVTLLVAGIPGKSLIPITLNVENHIKHPTEIIFASIEYMKSVVSEFDYFINIEDDIFLPKETFQNVIEFDRISLVNEILHPNRIERISEGLSINTDLQGIPDWTYSQKFYLEKEWRIAKNPHSAIAIFSQEKLNYAIKERQKAKRNVKLYVALDEAFATIHAPFQLWRSYSDPDFHFVEHLDQWIKPTYDFFPIFNFYDLFPVFVLKLATYIKKKYYRRSS
jgi:hypothetical protein